MSFVVMRRRPPRSTLCPDATLCRCVRAHLAKGKPLVGIRTASHAFDREPPSGDHARWTKFDDEILGVDYRNHYGNKPPKAPTVIRATTAGTAHPILTGVPHDAFEAKTQLYKNKPVASTVTVLMTGKLAELARAQV